MNLIQIHYRLINLDTITDIEYDPQRLTLWHGSEQIERVECDDPNYAPLKAWLESRIVARFNARDEVEE